MIGFLKKIIKVSLITLVSPILIVVNSCSDQQEFSYFGPFKEISTDYDFHFGNKVVFVVADNCPFCAKYIHDPNFDVNSGHNFTTDEIMNKFEGQASLFAQDHPNNIYIVRFKDYKYNDLTSKVPTTIFIKEGKEISKLFGIKSKMELESEYQKNNLKN